VSDLSQSFEVSAQEVQKRLQTGERLFLIDVREPFEHEIANLADAELIPMNSVPAALQQLEAKADQGPLMILCHHGVRSLNVVNWLRRQGIENCFSVRGGLDLWSLEIDPKIPRY
jgi:rhodanese-related sulfurtransferase